MRYFLFLYFTITGLLAAQIIPAKGLRLVGDVNDLTRIEFLLRQVPIDDHHLFEAVQKVVERKPDYPVGTGIGIGAPKATLEISNKLSKIAWRISLYKDERQSLIFISKVVISLKGNAEEYKGWYLDRDLYEKCDKTLSAYLTKKIKEQDLGTLGSQE